MAVAVSVTAVSSVVVGLSLPLGNMDGSSGVGDVSAGTSVSSSYGGDGSRGSSKGGQRGRRRDAGVAGDHWVSNSVDNRGSDGMVGVAHNWGNMAGRVDTVVGFSLTLSVAVDTVTVAETQSPVATVVATKTIAAVAVVGIGLSLRFGFPLAVDTVRSETVSPVATVAAKAVATVVAAKTIVGIGIGLGFSGGEGRKGKCQDSLHVSSATFCDKPCVL